MRQFYLVMMAIGTVVPWILFGGFFAAEGFDIPLFARSLFPNGAAAGFTVDVLVSIVVFLVWSYADATRAGIRRWWLVLPATCLVGLSLALPLYLYLRASRDETAPAPSAPTGVPA
ncbi:DUF2834 domain-containing protein [Tsukamurella spumae]|uniref:DUF2834 domain-containing protein n=1 Tax=Tsukamurella spumae TaxID=44753 RepID=A0A846X8J1_9ACTN|nr:DUF2834 domain-containing protein [Tsukamurella spumae]NKY20905.1 DUF2834 domain-containing protein [Tsukamurella spumae]